MNGARSLALVCFLVLLACCAAARGNIVIDTVPVGNAGNAGELSGAGAGGYGTDRICGSVGYTYNIGKYEVTAGQYSAFLNAVAGVDAYGLYNTDMSRTDYGSGISRSGGGTIGNPYTYSVASAFVNRPVNYVSYWDSCRFANWLHNGQPTGAQGPGTTETGAYTLTTDGMNNNTVARNSNWQWAVTSEDEWYKAAYHRNNGMTGDYWYYPTSSDTAPGRDMADASGNNANCYTGSGPYPIDSPYYTTVAGEFQNSDSPYGTFDQGGNVWEWNEAIINGSYRGVRGESFGDAGDYLHASDRYDITPSDEYYVVGFRLSEVSVALPGDMNCDGTKNGWDVAPFVLAMIDPSGYEAAYPRCQLSNADFDCDGGADTADVDGFVDCLLTGNCPACPPPTGSCCYPDGACSVTFEADCTGTWQGAGSDCDPHPCPLSGMALIPAGEFLMGDSFGEGSSSERPVHAVYVDAFYMDTCEVTNQQYADALNWAKHQGNLITVTSGVVYKYNSGTSYPYCNTTMSSGYSRITWNGTSFGVTSGKTNYPMGTVSWYGSVAYANWRSAMQGKPLCYDLSTWTCNFGSGYRLPTEAEWEKAARGGAAGHRFPWSDTDTIQHARANYFSDWVDGVPYYPYDTSPTPNYHPCWGVGSDPYANPVGFFSGALQYKVDWGWPGSPTSYQTTNSVNGYGLYDMAGNVSEWCNDSYESTYYSSSPYNNPHGPSSGGGRVMRGGSSYGYSEADQCRVADRFYSTPGYYYADCYGFRCALGCD